MLSLTDAAQAIAAPPYIRISHVDKTYESRRSPVQALRDIDFDIANGEFVSILGPSGCGKSTLLKCVAGLEPVSGGRIEVAGIAVRQSPENLGIVFQRDVLLDWRTVVENVLVVAELKGLDPRPLRSRALELLRSFGLESFVDRYPWELSGGMRQRVSICRALLLDPQLLLMDEPFGALDAMTRDELNVELRRMWMDTRKTILFITHSVTEAVYLSDRIVVMSRNPGRIAEVIDVNLPPHRPLSVRGEADFSRYTAHILWVFSSMGILKGD